MVFYGALKSAVLKMNCWIELFFLFDTNSGKAKVTLVIFCVEDVKNGGDLLAQGTVKSVFCQE